MDTLDLLDRLIAFDTISAKSNLSLIGFVEDYLSGLGFRVQRLEDESGLKCGLYAEIGPAGDGILLSGHTDVVPVEGQNWSRDPFRLSESEGKLYGRGTTDMKGFVASVLSLAAKASTAKLNEPLKIVLSYDEEVGCVGIQHMLERLAPMIAQPRACIVGEPTEMQVAVGHKGKAAISAQCSGQAGHSAQAPDFVNALHVAAEFVTELRGLQDKLATTGARDEAYDIPYSTIHVGRLTGGTALNIVPDRAEVLLEYRHLAQDRPADIFARIKAAAGRVEDRYRDTWSDVSIFLDRFNTYPGLSVDCAHPVVGLVKRVSQSDGTTKVAFGTEAGFFDELGIPTVVCGPGSMADQGHKPDEFIARDALTACDHMMDRTLDEISP